MYNFIAGILVFLLLLIAKRVLIFILFSSKKKQVAFLLTTIVISELLIVFILFIFIDKYRSDGVNFFIGFLMGLVVMVVYYCYKFLSKGSEKIEDGKL